MKYVFFISVVGVIVLLFTRFIKRKSCKHYFSTWLYDYEPIVVEPLTILVITLPWRSKWKCNDCGKEYSCREPKNKKLLKN